MKKAGNLINITNKVSLGDQKMIKKGGAAVVALFPTIDRELKLVQAKVKDELSIQKMGYVGAFAHLEFPEIDNTIRPALVIFSARLFNNKSDVIIIASIVQYIYLASQVHAQITEGDTMLNAEIDPRDGCQFPVLVGDYLYGKFFDVLSKSGNIAYLKSLAELICTINESAVLKNQHPKANLKNSPDLIYDIIYKETAVFFAKCTSIAALIAGANEDENKHIYKFGLNFGLGYGLLQWGATYQEVAKYFEQATKTLDYFTASTAKQALLELGKMVSKKPDDQ